MFGSGAIMTVPQCPWGMLYLHPRGIRIVILGLDPRIAVSTHSA
jgi:hypothetical protein